MIWDKGGILKPRASSLRVVVDHASLPGPPGFWTAHGVACPSLPSLRRMWLFGPTVSASFLTFPLFWPRCIGPRALLTSVKFGVSDPELLIMFEQIAGHPPTCEKVIRPHLRARRPLVGSSCPASIGSEIRQGCQFIHGLLMSLGHLPGRVARFVPCQPSAHHTRLSHVGWEHVFSSRPVKAVT